MEAIFLLVLMLIVLGAWTNPDKNSTSYRLGKGLGNKTRKFGNWLMSDDD